MRGTMDCATSTRNSARRNSGGCALASGTRATPRFRNRTWWTMCCVRHPVSSACRSKKRSNARLPHGLRSPPATSSARCKRCIRRHHEFGDVPMSLKCGIVGLPNVGKSTLFNALTKAGIAAENYPFCTIDPNVGIVEVPDPRLAALAAIAHPEKVIPATVEFVDIAGLVAGASKGEGLGNQFLANIRETDAIAHVVRCFEDPNVVHVGGRIDPVGDV